MMPPSPQGKLERGLRLLGIDPAEFAAMSIPQRWTVSHAAYDRALTEIVAEAEAITRGTS